MPDVRLCSLSDVKLDRSDTPFRTNLMRPFHASSDSSDTEAKSLQLKGEHHICVSSAVTDSHPRQRPEFEPEQCRRQKGPRFSDQGQGLSWKPTPHSDRTALAMLPVLLTIPVCMCVYSVAFVCLFVFVEACKDNVLIWNQKTKKVYKASESAVQLILNFCIRMRVFWVYLLCPEAVVLIAISSSTV